MEAACIDLLAFPGRKSLLGPTGTGALCVGKRATLKSFREGGTGGDSILPTQPADYPTWLEAGTHDTVGLEGLSAALDEEFRMAVRPGPHCAPHLHRAMGTSPDGTIRTCPGLTTMVEAIDMLIAAPRKIATQAVW